MDIYRYDSTIIGNVTNYELINNPNGIFIDLKNGTIYGQPDNDVIPKIYNIIIKACNTIYCKTIEKELKITQLKCQSFTYKSILFEETNAGLINTKYCPDGYNGNITIECLLKNPAEWSNIDDNCIIKSPDSIEYNQSEYNVYQNIYTYIPPPKIEGYTYENTTYIIKPNEFINNLKLNDSDYSIYGIINTIENTYNYNIKLCNDKNEEQCTPDFILKLKVIYIYCDDNDDLFPSLAGTPRKIYECPGRDGIIDAECPAKVETSWILYNFTCAPKSFEYQDKIIFYIGYSNFTYFPSINDEINYFTSTSLPNNLFINSTNGELYGQPLISGLYFVNISACNKFNICIDQYVTITIKDPSCPSFDINPSSTYPYIIHVNETKSGMKFSFDCRELDEAYKGSVEVSCSNRFEPVWGDVEGFCELRTPDSIQYDSDILTIYYNMEVQISRPFIKGYYNENSTFVIDNQPIDDLIFDPKSGSISGVVKSVEQTYQYHIKLCNGPDMTYCCNSTSLTLTVVWLYCNDNDELPPTIIGTTKSSYPCPNRSGYIEAECPLSTQPKWDVIIYSCAPKSIQIDTNMTFYIGYSNFSYTPTIDGKVDEYKLSSIPNSIIFYSLNGTVSCYEPIFENIYNNIYYSSCYNSFCISQLITITIIQPKCPTREYNHLTLNESKSGDINIYECQPYHIGSITVQCPQSYQPDDFIIEDRCVFDETCRCIESDGWDEVYSYDMIVYKRCSDDSNGVMERHCYYGNWSEVQSGCHKDVPDLSVYERLISITFEIITNTIDNLNDDYYVGITRLFANIFNIKVIQVIIIIQSPTSSPSIQSSNLLETNKQSLLVYLQVSENECDNIKTLLNDINNVTFNDIVLILDINSISIYQPPSNDNNKSSTNYGLIFGLIGGLLFVIIVIIIIVIMMRRNKKIEQPVNRRTGGKNRSRLPHADRRISSRLQIESFDKTNNDEYLKNLNDLANSRTIGYINVNINRGGNHRRPSTRSSVLKNSISHMHSNHITNQNNKL